MSILRKTLKSPTPFHQIYRFLTTSAQYDDLINAAGREKDFTTVHHLLAKRFKDGCFNTNNTFKFIATDLSVLDDLLQALSRLDKGFTRKSAYDSLIARLCKLHRPEEALRVVQEMIRNKLGANAVTFHPILNALTRKKEMEGAWSVMDLMREKGIVPDLNCYNSILTAYCFVGNLASAAEVLTRIKDEGLEADNRTYDALVLGACRAGKVDGALAIMRRQVEERKPSLYATHGHVIGGLLERGYYAQAVELVMAYAGRNNIGLDSVNFGTLARRLIDLKRVDEAVFVLGEMKKRSLPMGNKMMMHFYEFHCKGAVSFLLK